MQVALIADLHGNLVALEAVLGDLETQGAEQVVCLGDVAASGPQPRETLARLRALDCPVVMGNADAWLLHPQPVDAQDDNARRFEAIDVWCAAQLAPDDHDYVRSFRPTVEVSLGGGAALLAFHGSPRSNTDAILSTTSEEALERMLVGFNAAVMAGGHTHVPMLRRYRDALLVNPGSVGLPFEQPARTGRERNPPWAEYALVRWVNGGLGVELRRVPVDAGAVIQAARDSDMPHAAWWAADWG